MSADTLFQPRGRTFPCYTARAGTDKNVTGCPCRESRDASRNSRGNFSNVEAGVALASLSPPIVVSTFRRCSLTISRVEFYELLMTFHLLLTLTRSELIPLDTFCPYHDASFPHIFLSRRVSCYNVSRVRRLSGLLQRQKISIVSIFTR